MISRFACLLGVTIGAVSSASCYSTPVASSPATERVSAEVNVCYQCVPPWEAITRWEQAQRILSPLPPP